MSKAPANELQSLSLT